MKKTAILALSCLTLLPSLAFAEDAVQEHGVVETEKEETLETHGGSEPFIKIGIPSQEGQHIDSAEDQEHADLPILHDGHGEAHGAAHGEHHGNDGLPQFDPSSFPSQIFWMAVVFISLYIFFSRKTLPDISKVIDKRQEHIQNDLDSASKLKEEAEKVKQAYEDILDEAREKSTSAFEDVETAIKAKTEKSEQQFAKKTTKALEETEGAIEKAKASLMPEIDGVAAKVAAEAAEKIIGVNIDEKYAQGVVSSLQGNKKAA